MVDLSKSNGDICKHDEIADNDGCDVGETLPMQLILYRALCTKADLQKIFIALGIIRHERNKGFLPSQCFPKVLLVFVIVNNKCDYQSRGVFIGSSVKSSKNYVWTDWSTKTGQAFSAR